MDKRQLNMAVRRRSSTDRLTMIVMGVFIVLAVITGIVLFGVARDIFKSWTATDLEGVAVETGKTGENNNPTGTDTTPIPMDTVLQPESGPEAEPWDGKSRINVLVMGLDYRDWEAGEKPRSDTMVLFTLDPITGSAGMLSIPRDMWVNIPGYDYAKINTAYYLGEIYNLPGGGPGLAMETVEQFLGVPIDYYAQVDFNAFVRFIDEIEGVSVYVKEPITVAVLGTNKKVPLDVGWVTLPGDIALAYARNRYSEGGDFDRAERTQQVIMGVRDRILKFDMLPTLITKAPILYKELSAGVRTNMTLDQAIRLALLAIQIDRTQIKQAVIGAEQVEFGFSPDGQQILKPIPDKIRLVRDELFTTGGPVGPAAVSEDSQTLMTEEKARISVQNGSGAEGLASRTAEWLRGQGLDVVDESNADQVYSVTTIFVYNGKPYTIRRIAELMGLENPRIYNRYDPNAPYDIAIALGQDWAAGNPMP